MAQLQESSRRRERVALALAMAAGLLWLAGEAHVAWNRADSNGRASADAGFRLRALEDRGQRLLAAVESAARRAAALPDARAALAGERSALPRLFRALEALQPGLPESPALAIESAGGATLAWARRTHDRFAPLGSPSEERRVYLVVGSVSTALVACAPVHGPDGRSLGRARAELPLQVRRNIPNAYLSDFDRLADGDPRIQVRYVDAQAPEVVGRALPPLPLGLPAREAQWRGPDGALLASVRVLASSPDDRGRLLGVRYRRTASALAALGALLWAFAGPLGWPRAVVGATAARLALLPLGLPLPDPGQPLLSPDTYASALPWRASPLDTLLRSPLDLFLTAAWTLFLALAALRSALYATPRAPAYGRALLGDLAALPLLAIMFAWISDTQANCSLDLESVTLLPRSLPHLVMQLALVFILGTGAALLGALMAWAGPFPLGRRGLLLHAACWVVLGGLAYRAWPRELIGLPLAPAIILFVLAASVGSASSRAGGWLAAASPGRRVALALTAVATSSALLYPSLVHFGEKSDRLRIERDHTSLILRQPRWREYILEEVRRRIDALEVLEQTPERPQRPLLEELAFSVWSGTDLAAFGLSSAVEIQDPQGRVISRFALNLPSLGAPPPLPASAAWQVGSEQLALGSATRPVLVARKLLSYHGEVHGAIHVYVGDDFWDLPFLTDPDPYSVLFRSGAPGAGGPRPLGLLAYERDRNLLFSSAERPPALSVPLLARLEATPSGRLWTTVLIDGTATHAYFFRDIERVYGILLPRLGADRLAADLVEAASGMTLLALAVLLGVMALRDLLGRRTLSLLALGGLVSRRFSLRLFVAFVAVGFLPVVVLQLLVREFVADRLRGESERQALELAAIARKAVEDFALLQRREPSAARPVTDEALVYIGSLVRNDLDVFESGRLLASSKRELYASGLLPTRVSGEVFRAVSLEGQPAALRTETIGGFSYLVVSVPVRLETSEPGLLSMSLALRQREVEAVLEDLYRSVRLASVLFLAAAALLAQSMARRISGPIRDLTAATRRVARGDLEARVAPVSRDDLRDLMDSFNQMAGDLHRQRRDLERSNRLAAWAEMARQVAHEVKNPLTPIQLSAEHLRRVFRDRGADFEATLERCTETILNQVASLRRIVTEFSAFARPPAGVLEPQDMKQLIQEVLAPYRAALPPEITLTVEAAEAPLLANGDRRLLERAVVNLVENALQAVGEQGQIAVRLLLREGRIEVEVEDTGPGMDPEILDRVFEPFFSTKTGGSGLGLALVRKIAEDHGGGVRLTSAAGQRTLAVLWLPPGARPAG